MRNLVLIWDHTSKSFQPRFKEDFRVVGIKGSAVEVKKNHGLLSTFHITDVRKTTVAEKVEELLQDFKKFGRKGKLCLDPELFEDLGWTLDRDPPDLSEFRDDNKDNKCKESVENTIKSVTQNTNKKQTNVQVHSVNEKTPHKQKLRRSQRLKAKIANTARNIKNTIKGNH